MPVVIDTFEALPASEPPPSSRSSGQRESASPTVEPETVERLNEVRAEREERIRAH